MQAARDLGREPTAAIEGWVTVNRLIEQAGKDRQEVMDSIGKLTDGARVNGSLPLCAPRTHPTQRRLVLSKTDDDDPMVAAVPAEAAANMEPLFADSTPLVGSLAVGAARQMVFDVVVGNGTRGAQPKQIKVRLGGVFFPFVCLTVGKRSGIRTSDVPRLLADLMRGQLLHCVQLVTKRKVYLCAWMPPHKSLTGDIWYNMNDGHDLGEHKRPCVCRGG